MSINTSSASSENGVTLDGVTVSFGPITAVENVSQTVEAGQFVSIVGPSGCGKSTLLNVIAGLHPPTQGEARVGDRIVTGPNRELGMVFQEDSTLPWKTVMQNVEFGLKIAGMQPAPRRERAQEMIDLVALHGFENHYPAQLSGGMRQRVAIARTLALDPRVLLMDEPFGALDQQTRLIVGEELLRIWRATRKTVVFVTHDIQEAVLLSQQVWVMSYRPGRIIDVVDVGLPDDRDAAVVSSHEFNEISNRIWDRVRGEAMRGFEQENRR